MMKPVVSESRVTREWLPNAIYNLHSNKSVILEELWVGQSKVDINVELPAGEFHIISSDKVRWQTVCLVIKVEGKDIYYSVSLSHDTGIPGIRAFKARMGLFGNDSYSIGHVFLMDEDYELYPFVYEQKYFPQLTVPVLLKENYWSRKISKNECFEH